MPRVLTGGSRGGLLLRTQPDARLVSLFREGQRRAFEEIVRRYRSQLVAFAGSIVPAHRAEDVAQDTLIRAQAALGSGDGEINLRPWLYAIARNRALNDLRDERVHLELDDQFDGVPQPPDVAARRADVRAVVSGLNGLPDAQRAALIGRELEGRSHEEIALALGTTAGSVRGLIFRARASLRDTLGALVPLPLLRTLLNADPSRAEVAGAGGMAASLTAGGGVALKAGTAVVAAVLAIGGGIALHHHDGAKSEAAGQHDGRVAVASLRGAKGGSSAGTGGEAASRESSSSGGSPQSGEGSKEGGGDSQAGGSSGPGGGGESGSSGPGSGGDSGGGGDRLESSAPDGGSGSGDGSGGSSDSGSSRTGSGSTSGSGDSGSASTDGPDGGSETTTTDTSEVQGG